MSTRFARLLAAWPVRIEDPRRIKQFAQSLGQRHKSDRVDAAMIALFAARRRPRPNTTRGAKGRGMSSGCIVGVMMRKLLLIARAVVRNGGVYDPAMIRFARP